MLCVVDFCVFSASFETEPEIDKKKFLSIFFLKIPPSSIFFNSQFFLPIHFTTSIIYLCLLGATTQQRTKHIKIPQMSHNEEPEITADGNKWHKGSTYITNYHQPFMHEAMGKKFFCLLVFSVSLLLCLKCE